MDETERQELRRARLAAAVDKAGSKVGLARLLGYKDGAFVGQMLRGEKPVTEQTIYKLESRPGFRNWFGTSAAAQADLVVREPGGSISYMEVKGTTDLGDDLEIPQFDTGGKMGNGLVLRDQPGVIHSWHVTPEWIQKNVRHYSAAKNLCIVTGFGDSMKPLFNPGDPLLVDTGVRTVEFDSIYFFRVENEGFIKRLQRIPGDGMRAISVNREAGYESWTIRPDMDFEVFGRVLKVWRGEDF